MQFLLIAVILLILGGVLLLSETPESDTVLDIVEEKTPVTNVELIGDSEETMMVSDEKIVMEAEEVEPAKEMAGIEEVATASGSAVNLVKTYFKAYNGKEFATACDIISDEKCNAGNEGDVARFGQEFEKMADGYANLRFWPADTTDFHSDVVCVEYDYNYQADPEVTLHEVMSFYVLDGKITSRVCEEKTADGESIGCPILSRRDFCL